MATETPGWFEPNPGDVLDARQAEAALGRLPPEAREVVTLRLWGGLTFEQVGHVVGLSAPTAFRKYRQGLEQIRNQLEAPCHPNMKSLSTSRNWNSGCGG